MVFSIEAIHLFLEALTRGKVEKSDFREWADYVTLLKEEGAVFDVQEDTISLLKEGFGQYSSSFRIPRKVIYIKRCGSTNDIARQHPGEEAIFVAADQYKGRGRLGRTWLGEAGKSLFVSFVVHPRCLPEAVARLSLIWMADLAKKLKLYVKWPNDLVNRDGEKIGGCLCELIDSKPTLVFGVGVNVHQQTPPIEKSSSLFLEGISYTRTSLLRELSQIVYEGSVDRNLDCWREHALYMGRNIRIRDIEGELRGIREDGALLVGDAIVMTGDVQLVEEI